MSACEDFELAVPYPEELSTLRLTSSGVMTEPQGLEDEKIEDSDSTPHHPGLLKEMGNTTQLNDYTNFVYFGESIRSFRQLIKRYTYYHFSLNDTSLPINTDFLMEIVHDSLPTEGGYTAFPGDFTYSMATTYYYVYAQMTLLKYITTAYGGWRGSTRWLFDGATGRRGLNGTLDYHLMSGVYHGSNEMSITTDAISGPLTTKGQQASNLERHRSVHGHNGLAYTTSTVNSSLAFEVPYYSRFRFTPAKQRTFYNDDRVAMPEFVVKYRGWNPTASDAPILTASVAAGEDFTCFYYLGPPVFYQETSYPTT
jgi:hypothetical protein